jgi:putative flippase GtrA
MSARFGRFAVVGLLGFIVQLAALWALDAAGAPTPLAVALAVACAVVHNFGWHERWTWSDRPARHAMERCSRFARFVGLTLVTSVAGNVVLTVVVGQVLRLPVVPANAIAVGLLAMLNFAGADRGVFAPGGQREWQEARRVGGPAGRARRARRMQSLAGRARRARRHAAGSASRPCQTRSGASQEPGGS